MAAGDRGRDREAVAAVGAAAAGGGDERGDRSGQAGTVVGDLDADVRLPVANARMWTRPPPCSIALATRFAHAWASRSGSPVTSAETGSTVSVPPRRSASARQAGAASAISATEVDRLAAPRAARTREVVERQRRAPQLEVDRLDARGALEAGERQLRDRQRPAHLVARASGLRLAAPAARVQRAHDQHPRQVHDHAATAAGAGRSATGPSIEPVADAPHVDDEPVAVDARACCAAGRRGCRASCVVPSVL